MESTTDLYAHLLDFDEHYFILLPRSSSKAHSSSDASLISVFHDLALAYKVLSIKILVLSLIFLIDYSKKSCSK